MGALSCGLFDTYAEDILRIRGTLPELASEIANFCGVAQVVDWLSARGIGQTALDLIGMDEFEYDFVVQCEQEACWLAFGVT